VKKVKVKMITAATCKLCKEAKDLIAKAATAEGVTVILEELDSESKEAVKLAVEFGVSKVPSFVINGCGFAGARHPIGKIKDALKWGQ